MISSHILKNISFPQHCCSSTNFTIFNKDMKWCKCTDCGETFPLEGDINLPPNILHKEDSIVIHSLNPPDHVGNWLQNFTKFFQSKGIQVHISSDVNEYQLSQFLQEKQVKHVFIWNGELPIHNNIKKVLQKLDINFSILEVGYFPQKKYYTIDAIGINGTAALMYDNLSWVEDTHKDKVASFKLKYSKGLVYTPEKGRILCPLQLDFDTNIINNSEFSTMQEFIHSIENRYKDTDKEIIFKKHPLDANTYTSKYEIATKGNFIEMAMKAEKVIGINSTCLLESTLLGIPTESVGLGFLSKGVDTQDLLAAILDKQVPVDVIDISYWVKKYAGVEVC